MNKKEQGIRKRLHVPDVFKPIEHTPEHRVPFEFSARGIQAISGFNTSHEFAKKLFLPNKLKGLTYYILIWNEVQTLHNLEPEWCDSDIFNIWRTLLC